MMGMRSCFCAESAPGSSSQWRPRGFFSVHSERRDSLTTGMAPGDHGQVAGGGAHCAPRTENVLEGVKIYASTEGCRDFSSFALPPGEPPALAALPRRRSHDLFAERPEAAHFSSFGPVAERGPFCGGPPGTRFSGFLLGLRSEGLFVEGPPGVLRPGRPPVAALRL